MFDLTSSKLLILGIVALLVVGPKELPALLRTIGKYVGIIRRHATDFRAQFDEAMREQELASLKAEMETVKRDVETTFTGTARAVEADVAAATHEIGQEIKGTADAVTAAPAAPATHIDAEPPAEATIEHRINGATPPLVATTATEATAPKAGA